MGKKIATFVLSAALVLAMCVTSFAADKGITVSGKGVVSVEPDTAVITFTIETEGSDAAQAQSKNSEIFKTASSALVNAGIVKNNIKTSWYRVYPKYKYDKDGNGTLIGYTVNNTFEVTTTDKDNVGKYIDTALKAGVTENGGIDFKLLNPEKYYSEALASSIKNAYVSAGTIANSLGVTLGVPVSVTELGNGNAYDINIRNSSFESAKTTADGVYNAQDYADIGYDNIEITANVTVVYSFN